MTGRHIVNSELERKRQRDDGTGMSHEKKIEILMTYIKKINANLCESRKKERITSDANDALKKQNLKLTRKINTLGRNLEILKAAAAMKSGKNKGFIL